MLPPAAALYPRLSAFMARSSDTAGARRASKDIFPTERHDLLHLPRHHPVGPKRAQNPDVLERATSFRFAAAFRSAS
jgi:hypothetical protein